MKTIGLACDHAGFELKEYVRGWLGWLLQWNRVNVIPVLLSAAVETESI